MGTRQRITYSIAELVRPGWLVLPIFARLGLSLLNFLVAPFAKPFLQAIIGPAGFVYFVLGLLLHGA